MCSSRCRSRPFRRHGWGSRPSTSSSPRARLPVRWGTQLRSPRSHRAGARRTSAPASVPAVRSSHDAAPPRPSTAQAGSAGEAADRAQTALDDPTNAEHLRRTRPRIDGCSDCSHTLRRPQEPLHRDQKGSITGRLGRRPGQPQSARPPPHRHDRLTNPATPIHEAARKRTNPTTRRALGTSSGVFSTDSSHEVIAQFGQRRRWRRERA